MNAAGEWGLIRHGTPLPQQWRGGGESAFSAIYIYILKK